MRFAAHSPGINPADVDRRPASGEGARVAQCRFGGNLVETNALDPRRRPGEIGLDDLAREADRIEDLGAAIGLKCRDAHLGHDLEHALADRLDIIPAQLCQRLVKPILLADRGEGLEGEIGIDRLGAISRKHAEMMDFAGFAGLHHEPGLHPAGPAGSGDGGRPR